MHNSKFYYSDYSLKGIFIKLFFIFQNLKHLKIKQELIKITLYLFPASHQI